METDITNVSTPGASEAAEPQHCDTRMQRGTEMSEQAGITKDTSDTVAPENNQDTAATEPDATEGTAETGDLEDDSEDDNELIAGKFKSQDDLIKAYKEAETFITKSKELEKTVQSLNQQLAQNQSAAQADYALREIESQAQQREFEIYSQSLDRVAPENFENVQGLLSLYYQTAHKPYLDAAKKLFSPDFVEQVAVEKQIFKNNLSNEFNQRARQVQSQREQAFYSQLEENYKDFLSDVLTDSSKGGKFNQAKAGALSAMFRAGAVTDLEDMDSFVKIYDEVAKQSVADYIAASKGDEEFNSIKEKAQIPTGTKASSILSTGRTPTYEDIKKMSQEQFNAAVSKYGLETIIKAK